MESGEEDGDIDLGDIKAELALFGTQLSPNSGLHEAVAICFPF